MAEGTRKRAAGGTSHALCHAGEGAPRAHQERREGEHGRPAPTRVGARFEAQARRFLERQRLVFVASNLVVRGGELDLVMREPDGTLVFVEVRARRQSRHGGALASIGWRKQQRLVAAARAVWARFGGASACRFDVVAFEAGRLVWLRDAFRADDA